MADESEKPEKVETPVEAARAMATTQAAADADEVAAAEVAASRDSEPVPPSAAPAPAVERRSGGSWWPWLLLLLIAVGVGGWFTRDAWLPRLTGPHTAEFVPPPPPSAPPVPAPVPAAPSQAPAATAATPTPVPVPPAPAPAVSTAAAIPAVESLAAEQDRLASAVAAIETRLDGLQQAVDEVRKGVDAVAGNGDDIKGLTGAVSGLEERIARLERSAIQTGTLESQVRELSAKALSLREGFASLNTAVLAVSQLGQAIAAGTPYVRELAAVRAIAGNDPATAEAIAGLEAQASSGIPTTASLAAQFPAVADAIARAAPTSGGDTWIDRVADKFASLVSIRATGPAAARAGGIDAALAQAEAELKAGDLAAAVDVVKRIEGQAAIPAAEWLQRAELRLTADRAVATLESGTAERLAKARG